MYARVHILNILFLFFKLTFGNIDLCNSGNNEILPSCVYEACDRLSDPEYITTSCCPEMDRFVKIINECKGDEPTISDCSQATCVGESYGVLTNGQVDLRKAEEAIIKLDARNPDRAQLNALVRKYCVRGNYTCFQAEDESCDYWKFMNCAFFAYRIGCSNEYRDCACNDIADDVNTCRPYQTRYIRELGRGCNSCSASPAPPRRRKPTSEFLEF